MMLKIALTAAAMSLLTLGAATAGSPEAPKTAKAAKARSQCFWTDQVNNFASSDDRIVNLRVGVKDYYQLEMLGRCQDVDWTQSIAIVSRGSSSICTGLDAEIIAPTPIGPQRCAVKTVRKLTPEEVKALPRRARP
jgi:hypothetical protein